MFRKFQKNLFGMFAFFGQIIVEVKRKSNAFEPGALQRYLYGP